MNNAGVLETITKLKDKNAALQKKIDTLVSACQANKKTMDLMIATMRELQEENQKLKTKLEKIKNRGGHNDQTR